jgi:MFS family permease
MSVLIGLSYRVSLIYLARFVQGFTQSLITSYAPIWINEFAPAEHATLWLGLFGGLSSIGIMVGYTICALLLSLFDEWRACFFIQAAAQVFIAVAIVFISENRFNVWTHDRASV